MKTTPAEAAAAALRAMAAVVPDLRLRQHVAAVLVKVPPDHPLRRVPTPVDADPGQWSELLIDRVLRMARAVQTDNPSPETLRAWASELESAEPS